VFKEKRKKMKKNIYMAPAIIVTNVELQSMVCTSVTSVSGLTDVEVSSEEFSGGSVDSRRGGSWDDDF